LRITHMQRFQNLLKAIFITRNSNKMNVVSHQTICQNLKLVFLAVVAQ